MKTKRWDVDGFCSINICFNPETMEWTDDSEKEVCSALSDWLWENFSPWRLNFCLNELFELCIQFRAKGDYSPATWDRPEESGEERTLIKALVDGTRLPSDLESIVFDHYETLIYEADAHYE